MEINMENSKSGISIREGRSNKQYINTNFDFIDALNIYADFETLGFYIAFKRYINRKDNTKENQITYTQAYLQKQFNIGRTDGYSAEELEAIARRKREEVYARYEGIF